MSQESERAKHDGGELPERSATSSKSEYGSVARASTWRRDGRTGIDEPGGSVYSVASVHSCAGSGEGSCFEKLCRSRFNFASIGHRADAGFSER